MKLVRSTAWDEAYDYFGKRIAVIGNGSSAIQIMPHLAKGKVLPGTPTRASHLTSFILSHAWISPAPGINEPTGDDPATGEHYNYAPGVLVRFKDDREAYLSHCRSLIDRRLTNFRRTHAPSKVQKGARELFTNSMRHRLGDTEKGGFIESAIDFV